PREALTVTRGGTVRAPPSSPTAGRMRRRKRSSIGFPVPQWDAAASPSSGKPIPHGCAARSRLSRLRFCAYNGEHPRELPAVPLTEPAAMSTSPSPANITSVLKETRVFPPPAEFAARARIPSMAEYQRLWTRARDDPDGFWAEQAERLHWFQRWSQVLVWKEPHAQWFVGGKINASYNCLDRHLDGPRRNKAALLWEGEPGGTR